MKKNIKIGLVLFIITFLSICIYKLDTVKIDNKIREEANKELKNKKYMSFLENSKNEVSTDISLEKNDTDTVYWQCEINEALHLNFIKRIHFHMGDGFSGLDINMIKFFNTYRISVNSYTDNVSDPPKKFTVQNQTLILDKNNHKKGDSIFGKINLKVEEKMEVQNSIYYVEGYFRGKIK